MRAAAANPESAVYVGIRVGWMTALGWGMAARSRRRGMLIRRPWCFSNRH